MRLTLFDRLALLGVLPREGSLLDIRATHALRQHLAPNDVEAMEIQSAANPEGGLSDTSEVALRTTEIELSPRALTLVQDLLKQLDGAKKLPENLIGVWDAVFPKEGDS